MTDDRVLHVTPTADLVDHALDDDCVCGPRAERVVRADGTDGWVIVHHSLDGREPAEQATDPTDPKAP
ncbi:hypothetical protein [Embleya sp. NPDC005971]|uniref:hypothetical protein n=1 Tax=Embleya sp. NPDC005971 TaxID=3156724 RepID=UPI0033F8E33D